MKRTCGKGSAKLATSLVNEFGYKELMKIMRCSAPNISALKKKGISLPWVLYINLKYPNLKVWKEHEEELKKLNVI